MVMANSEFRPVGDIPRTEGRFRMVSDYSPAGDQPQAIDELERRIESGEKDIVLLGATGTGKSATTAWLIERIQRPTLLIAPNKTLAAQLANELREYFPNNAVEYFVSYYDYYQHGIDLGPLQPRLKELVCTPSGMVELAPPQLVADVARLRTRLAAPLPEMLLIGRRQLRSNNSWLHNVATLVGGSNRCTLHVNPGDVARLGLGERAVVRSAAGELVVPVEPTDAIMPGVVSLPHGWGHAGSTQTVAAEHAGVNANTLTDESVVDVLSGNAVFNGVPVSVGPVDSARDESAA